MSHHITQTDEILEQMTDADSDAFSEAAHIAARDIATCPESHRIKRTAQWAAVFTYFVQDRIEDYLEPEPEDDWTADTVITTTSGVPIIMSRHTEMRLKGDKL